jgi:hypothetical protein
MVCRGTQWTTAPAPVVSYLVVSQCVEDGCASNSTDTDLSAFLCVSVGRLYKVKIRQYQLIAIKLLHPTSVYLLCVDTSMVISNGSS